jgi:hypothetical protein
MKTFLLEANSMMPGTSVFYGDPLMNEHPSKMVAAAKMVDGEISGWEFAIASSRFS